MRSFGKDEQFPVMLPFGTSLRGRNKLIERAASSSLSDPANEQISCGEWLLIVSSISVDTLDHILCRFNLAPLTYL